ncbi:hypothetical protein LOK49_LG01G02512 [Camellia lanceoleosa]|uniref:Uncharacterized protein n=1 Tax=Camellia lanceoleosa TaxID=1840588 RepID=A0ACC0IVT5_9ERIC|nr:hypothetical protein LOK49_LG01G02512 [Camellia lanceoleosa]
MDRRSWLWRRKSSEKSPGETESSGSASSHSERFSDDQAWSNHHTQSPEVTSKSCASDELNDSVKTLTEKLAEALLNIRAKEDLVKQHAKVAEEAVSGWEKAESEVLALKQQLEVATQKNSSLEDRVNNLDGALKECVRQLRQAREEQDQKIHEAVAKKTREWESTKSELESQLVELQSQHEATKAKSLTSIDPDFQTKLEAAEKENSALKLELLSRVEELEIRIIERDLSTQAAETASKQHLESIKKVARLEAECRRLKAGARKASSANDHRSVTASSVYVESFTDSQSDSGERLLVVDNESRKFSGLEPNECEPSHSDSWASALIAELDQFKNENAIRRNVMVPSVDINLMDDFLEMERLAALPETESGSCCPESGVLSDQPHGGESHLKAELDAMINRTAELEEKLEKMEMEKAELEMALTECQDQVKISRDQLMEVELKLVELQTRLDMANEANSALEAELGSTNANRQSAKSELVEVELKLVELQTQLSMANEARSAFEVELGATNAKRELAESQLMVVEAEIKTLLSKVGFLEEEVQKERALSGEAVIKCRKMEDEIQKERVLSGEAVVKCRKMEDEILRMKHEVEIRNTASWSGDLKIKQDKELAIASSKFAECQKTIASLGAIKIPCNIEDFLMDSEKTTELPKEGSQFPEDGPESLKLPSCDLHSPKNDSEDPKTISSCPGPLENGGEAGSLLSRSQQPAVTVEKSRNGFGKLFPRSNSRRQNETR